MISLNELLSKKWMVALGEAENGVDVNLRAERDSIAYNGWSNMFLETENETTYYATDDVNLFILHYPIDKESCQLVKTIEGQIETCIKYNLKYLGMTSEKYPLDYFCKKVKVDNVKVYEIKMMEVHNNNVVNNNTIHNATANTQTNIRK